jgi:hypothetical protein
MLRQGLTGGQAAAQSQACGRHQRTGSSACPAEPALEPGLCSQSDGVGSAVPGTHYRRRYDQVIPAGGAGHTDLRSQGRA